MLDLPNPDDVSNACVSGAEASVCTPELNWLQKGHFSPKSFMPKG